MAKALGRRSTFIVCLVPMPDSFTVIAIPLRRDPIIDFLEDREPDPRGASLRILAQRPSAAAQSAWADHLRSQPAPTIPDLLAITDPHAYLTPTYTDRLVPEQFLQEPGFLRRNLGGWSPVYFGVAEIPKPLPDDPLFDHLEVLTTYGATIQSFGADPRQVEQRLPDEMSGGLRHVAASVGRLDDVKADHADAPDTYTRVLHEALAETASIQTSAGRPVPTLLLCDAHQNSDRKDRAGSFFSSFQISILPRARSWCIAWRGFSENFSPAHPHISDRQGLLPCHWRKA